MGCEGQLNPIDGVQAEAPRSSHNYWSAQTSTVTSISQTTTTEAAQVDIYVVQLYACMHAQCTHFLCGVRVHEVAAWLLACPHTMASFVVRPIRLSPDSFPKANTLKNPMLPKGGNDLTTAALFTSRQRAHLLPACMQRSMSLSVAFALSWAKDYLVVGKVARHISTAVS